MNKKAIIINYTGRRGGGAIASYEIAKALLEQGATVIPIISKQVENLEMWENTHFEKIIAIGTYYNKINFIINTILFNRKYKKKILEQIKEYNVKAVYCPMVTYWTGRINKFFPQAKKIVGLHDPIPHSGESKIAKIMALLQSKTVFGTADEIIVHSQKFVDYVKKKYGKAYYLPLGPHYPCGMVLKAGDIKKKSDTIDFLFFGRIEAYKGLDILAEAYRKLKRKYDKITLTIAGNGVFSDYEVRYRELDDVKIINRWIQNEEIANIFLGGNIISVCPYKDATQSGVVLTSYIFGDPVIATDTGGLGEQVIDGKTGFLVEPNNADALEKAMEMFITNKNLVSDMQEEIREYLDDVSWEKSAGKLLQLVDWNN